MFYKKDLFKEKSGELNKKQKGFLTAIAMAIKDLTASIRKHTNELKVHEKTEERI